MAGEEIIITDAGRAELTRAGSDEISGILLSSVKFGRANYVPTKELTDLKDAFKEISTVGGAAVDRNTIHLDILDSSSDEYNVSELGLYTSDGVLFAVYSKLSGFLVEKSSSAAVVLSIDIKVTDVDVDKLQFGNVSFTVPPATTEKSGRIEIATITEVRDGSDNSRAVTPKSLEAVISEHKSDANAHDKYVKITDPTPDNDSLSIVKRDASKTFSVNTINFLAPTRSVGVGGRGEIAWRFFDGGEKGLQWLTKNHVLEYLSLTDVAKLSDIPTLPTYPGSNRTNGYRHLPGGVILQWGTPNDLVSRGHWWNFPIAFPRACFSVVVTEAGSQQNPISVSQQTRIRFLAHGGLYSFIAVGY